MRRTPITRRVPLRARPGEAVERPPAPPMDLVAAAEVLARQQAALVAPRPDYVHPQPVSLATARPSRTGFPTVVRQTIIERDGYACQRCGRNVDGDTGVGYSLQHRKARSMGGTDDPRINLTSNGVLMCGSATTGCHGWAEANPAAAERTGFAVARWADPETVPMLTSRGWVLISNRGHMWPTAGPISGDAHVGAQRISTFNPQQH